MLFSIFLFLLSIMFSRFVYVIACISISFFFICSLGHYHLHSGWHKSLCQYVVRTQSCLPSQKQGWFDNLEQDSDKCFSLLLLFCFVFLYQHRKGVESEITENEALRENQEGSGHTLDRDGQQRVELWAGHSRALLGSQGPSLPLSSSEPVPPCGDTGGGDWC